MLRKLQVGETLLKIVVEEAQVSTHVSENPTPTQEGLKNIKPCDSELTKNDICEVLSTPAVRNLAKQHGVDLNDVKGTGKDGRILKEDVLQYAFQKGSIKDPSASLTSASRRQFLGGEEDHPHPSGEVPWSYEDKTVPLR